MSELNPNHLVTHAVHDYWHKIAALLMIKMGKRRVSISMRDMKDMEVMPGGCNITIETRGDMDCIVLNLVTNEEAKRIVEREGGKPA